MCGFANALAFKTINDADIDFVENRIRNTHVEDGHSIEYLTNIFGKTFASNPSQFQFLRGERKHITELIKHVKNVVDKDGINRGIHRFKPTTEMKNPTWTCPICSGEKKESNLLNEEDIVNSNNPSKYLLKKLITATVRHSQRKPGGYRYDPDIKLFAAYLRMIAGPLAYQTLQKNLQSALPSLPSTNRYISSSNYRIVEGIPRYNELLIYLNERNLPLVVSLSEDATRIVGKMQYDSSTNQVVGFVQPINRQTGMPIAFSYPARNAPEILSHFASGNEASAFINVIMVQPIVNKAPAFCLLLFGSNNKYSSTDVKRRWTHIALQLAKLNIKVLSISSDSDPKYNAAMRRLSELGYDSNDFPNWFSCGEKIDRPFYVQDTVHIATKIRNFLLNMFWRKKQIPFGKHFVNMEHLFCLLNMFPKDQHMLTASILSPTDRQNFNSVLKMCSVKVVSLLRGHVKHSQATVIFIQMLRDIVDSYMDQSLKPLQRVRKLWYSLFLVRIWREWVLRTKNYTLRENFFSANTYSCIELNAHSLVSILLYLKQTNQPELFLPHLFSSQPCESIFRQLRSFTTTYSTVVSSTVKESISRISKIHFQNEIFQITSPDFIYPRINNQCSNESKFCFELPSREEIIKEIEFCQRAAVLTATKLGLISKSEPNKIYTCKINPFTENKKSKLKTHIKPTKQYTHTIKLRDLKNIQLIDYTGKIKRQVIDETSPYAEIQCNNNKKIIVKKTSLCWLFNVDSKKISSDRTKRVQYSAAKTKCANTQKMQTKVRTFKRMYCYNPCRNMKSISIKKKFSPNVTNDKLSKAIKQLSVCTIKDEGK